jgi:tripartite-type tricarboxylate transporter receptor subunit TctC
MMFATVATALPNIKSGNLKPIVIAGPSRSAALPNVPTMNELGVKSFNTDAWFGIVAPVGVPQEIVLRLNKEINSAITDPEVNAKLVSLGLRPAIMSLPEFSAYVKSESTKWGELVRLSGATLD